MSMSDVFENIFSTPEASEIWSDRTRTSLYLRFEGHLARVQGNLGIIPGDAAIEIESFCSNINNIDFEELRRDTEKIGYPILGLVQQIVRGVNEKHHGLGEWAHYGATTQDVTDTASVLQLGPTLESIATTLTEINDKLNALARRYASTTMAARSNLQQAVPITFGFKLARLLATFRRHSDRLNQLRKRVIVLQFGGAAGTLASLPADRALECQEKLSIALGIPIPEIAWHTERDGISEAGGFFALLTATCAKFAMDVKLMMQSEVAEVSEPFHNQRGSSSTMPQKRNPIACAYITGMAATVRAHSSALYEAMIADHERSTGPWQIEWIVLPEICKLTCATMKHTLDLISGMEVHPDAMARNLEITQGKICSEAVMMALANKLGRQVAHDLIYDLCRRSTNEGVPLLELLCVEEKVVQAGLDRNTLSKLCEPANYLGLSVEMVDRVCSGTYR